jgi:putative FmdB family regulatory protein
MGCLGLAFASHRFYWTCPTLSAEGKKFRSVRQLIISNLASILWDDSQRLKLQLMPLYEYEVCDGDCIACGGKFTLRRPLSAPELKQCPACKKPVRKLISNFSSPLKLKPLSISDAKKSGFTVLKRLGKGEYERQ